MSRFIDLDTDAFAGAVIIVDVDGTIVNDGGTIVDAQATAVLAKLSRVGEVYLCSNSTETGRIKTIAASVPSVRFLDSIHKKPSKLILNSIPSVAGRRLVVIGDKHLTDGRFARNIAAEFFPVVRVRHYDDKHSVVATYLIDDTYAFFGRAMLTFGAVIKLMRVKQWIKNVLVFAPLFFAQEALSRHNAMFAAEAFVGFCLAASTVYVMNDIFDIDTDRAHPKKRLRPLASGALSVTFGYAILGILLAATIALIEVLPSIAVPLSVYLVLNVFYSLSLKHIAILDIACVATFYILRIIAGSASVSTPTSPWIILCVFFGALFLVIGKRRVEFLHVSRRRVIESYSMQALDYLLMGSSFLAIISYAIYSAIGSRSPLAIYSTIFVVIAIFRLLNRMFTDSSNGEAEYPESLLFKDPWALGAFLAWAVYMFSILYVL